MTTPPNPERILRSLAAEGVEYVVVGGIAVVLRGSQRVTIDLDIVPRPTEANVRALLRALTSVQGTVVDADGVDRSAETIRLGEPARLETDGGALDIVQGLPGVPEFAVLAARAERIELYGMEVAVAGVDDLIAMKRAAGRPQDLEDIAFLASLDQA
jgi:predicted nucleotidyltransferase